MQKRKLVRILDIVLVALLVANIVSYTHKKETKLLHANYNILVQESAGSSNYVEYPGLTFPTRGYELSSYTCENHATSTQNSVTKALNFDGSSNKCTLKFNISSVATGQTLQKLQELSSQWQVKSGNPNLGRTSPHEYFIHGGFNTNTQTNTVNANRYLTYASDFIVDPETGKYSLVNPKVMLSSSYGDRHDLEGQYVVAPTGSTSNQLANYQNLDTIYKVTQTHMIGLTYYIYTQSAYTSTAVDNSECGIYSSPDNYGTSYYVRGKYDYNYVKFGKDSDNKDLYWRIVRINGDESLRIIYAGTSATAKSNIGKSTFNETIDDNTYVGYMTGTSGASSYAQTHNNVNNSTIKTMLDNWYNENLLKDDDKIEYGLFCNDRSLQSGNGYGMDTTYYKSYNRNITNKAPSLLCPEKNDRFTVNDTTIGNGKLTRPIGLITEDELAYGGMVNNKSNTNSYLSKTDSYWTMTPADFATEKAWVMGYYQNQLKVLSVNSNSGVVPVINLTPEAVQAFTGTGTASNPFVISEDGTTTNPSISLLNKIQSLVGSDSSLVQDGTTDNNIRYIGANPNNYISFNGELWRIIGVMNNVKDANGNPSSRVKIVRNDSIGSYVWDTSYTNINGSMGANEWSQAKVMQLLNPGYENYTDFNNTSANNSLYLNKASGKCYNDSTLATTNCSFVNTGLTSEATYLIDDVTWNTGAINTDDYKSTTNGLISKLYTNERSNQTGKICTASGLLGGTSCNDNITRTTSWIGKIALPYASDYGFATGGGNTKSRTQCLNYYIHGWNESGYSDCYNNNWLFHGNSWFITPVGQSSTAVGAMALSSAGNVAGQQVYGNYDIIPALYLKQDVSYISGSGTQADPFVVH